MGIEMACNLQKYRKQQGHSSIIVYNRTKSKCQTVAELGAQAAASVAEVVQTSDLLFLSLFGDHAVKQTVTDILTCNLQSPLLIADTSTISPDTTKELLQLIRDSAKPVKFCQTPVWGIPAAAKAAQLVFVLSAGSDNNALTEITVPAIARTTLDCGDDPVKAVQFKILGNFLISSTLEAVSEGMAVVREAGISPDLYLQFIKEMMPARSIVGHASKLVEDDGEASKTNVAFSVAGGMKDVKHAIGVAESVGMKLPIAELTLQHLQWVADNGDANWDWSALAYALRKN
ncbi:hypothetical protein IWW36_000981 [Coemansia brasiliensis]|uniref:6-phosphogluconate dehydrogenase n=1 Tax=Coemansia brasiliensis TaxID=2650707 RepID=A0A9W8M2G8_9FUNG|nr:hypothetical protein IWW36_000981 [Coemansia brasiliensis]